MENEKPFKTIEVIDARTNQACKVACMSCIRGHRTTSCGIPVCRNKVFWTVKRPGRPSNSCTCRYGATGGCKCVVAKFACPHKSKKGEKRSSECRCDEQGRYCCIIDPEHWNTLLALGKPTVDFYPSREALEARNTMPTPMSMPMTPGYIVNSPRSYNSTPAPPVSSQTTQSMPNMYDVFQSPPPQPLTPQFSVMGIDTPQRSEPGTMPDELTWQSENIGSCCQGPRSPIPSVQSQQHSANSPHELAVAFDPFSSSLPGLSIPDDGSNGASIRFDFESKFATDYLNYQLPSAICQTCGLNGCTCRNCPPVMQSFSTGSWAQCCGRKHARTAAYVAPTAQHQYQQPSQSQQTYQQHTLNVSLDRANGALANHVNIPAAGNDTRLDQEPVIDFQHFAQNQEFDMPNEVSDLDLSEFLLEDLERPSGGCCCGDP